MRTILGEFLVLVLHCWELSRASVVLELLSPGRPKKRTVVTVNYQTRQLDISKRGQTQNDASLRTIKASGVLGSCS